MTRITKPQMRKLYATARERDIDNDLLHDMVKSRYKKDHIPDLTIKQAADLIDHMETGKTVPLSTGRMLFLATDGQIYKIHHLEHALGWADNPSRLRGFIKKYAGTERIEWLTKEQAWRIIEGLKSILEQAQKERSAGVGMD